MSTTTLLAFPKKNHYLKDIKYTVWIAQLVIKTHLVEHKQQQADVMTHLPQSIHGLCTFSRFLSKQKNRCPKLVSYEFLTIRNSSEIWNHNKQLTIIPNIVNWCGKQIENKHNKQLKITTNMVSWLKWIITNSCKS